MSSTLIHAHAAQAAVLARPVSAEFGCSTYAAPTTGTPITGTSNGRGWTMAWANADLAKRFTPGVLGGLT